jgi:Mak10 subunit, NatC N(alpha)-terminal acetyltransferase
VQPGSGRVADPARMHSPSVATASSPQSSAPPSVHGPGVGVAAISAAPIAPGTVASTEASTFSADIASHATFTRSQAPSSDPIASSAMGAPAVARSAAANTARTNVDGGECNSTSDGWEDCTELLTRTTTAMRVGEMVHLRNFSMYAAMSAIELMEPKMDLGCGPARNVRNTPLPTELSDAEVVRICDELLACLATWMHAHTLPQTVFSCAYVQRIEDIPRPELAAFIHVLLATVAMFRHIVRAEQVADEEDFIAFDFGLKLPHLPASTVAKLVRDALSNTPISERSPAFNDLQSVELFSEAALSISSSRRDAVASRLYFLQAFHALLSSMYASRSLRFGPVRQLIDSAKTHLQVIQISQYCGADEVVPKVFDPTFNRHLLANTPPRTSPHFTRSQAFATFSQQLEELHALTCVKGLLLPLKEQLGRGSPLEGAQKYSFQALVYGLICFTAQWNPTVLTRSLLKRMILPDMYAESPVLSVDGAQMSSLLVADVLGHGPEVIDAVLQQQAFELSPCAVHIVWSLCRNRGRQRRNMIKSLSSWNRVYLVLHGQQSEQSQLVVSSDIGKLGNDASDVPSLSNSLNADTSDPPQFIEAAIDAGPMLSGIPIESLTTSRHLEHKTNIQSYRDNPLEVLSLEVSVRLMVQHWLLGFECNLYHPSEYSTVFFYVAYVLERTSVANIRAAYGINSSQDAGMQPPRLALYMLDEARWKLCRATFALIEALQNGKGWNYVWRREQSSSNMNSCTRNIAPEVTNYHSETDDQEIRRLEELWYDQRFGMMKEFRVGPPFLNYQSYLRLRNDFVGTDSLCDAENISRILLDACDSFKNSRPPLARAVQLATACRWDPLVDEAKALARVATRNCIVISRLLKLTENLDIAGRDEDVVRHIKLFFDEHRQFPVVSIQTNSHDGELTIETCSGT